MTSAPVRPAAALLAAALLAGTLAACTGTAGGPVSSPPSTDTTSPTPTSTVPPPVECPGAGEFEEGVDIAEVVGELSDSSLLGSISWDVNDQCETFVFEFRTSEGAPATSVPGIQIGHLDTFQILRVSLGVNTSVLTDQLVETELVDELYVVRALDGGTFVDLHLSSPAAARARVQSSPAALIVDLRPGFVEFTGAAETGDDIVLASPLPGAEVSTPAQLTGYSRTFESDVVIIVTQGGAVVAETATTAAASLETWGEFRAEVALPPGDVSVFAGESSPEDGSLSGITIDLLVS